MGVGSLPGGLGGLTTFSLDERRFLASASSREVRWSSASVPSGLLTCNDRRVEITHRQLDCTCTRGDLRSYILPACIQTCSLHIFHDYECEHAATSAAKFLIELEGSNDFRESDGRGILSWTNSIVRASLNRMRPPPYYLTTVFLDRCLIFTPPDVIVASSITGAVSHAAWMISASDNPRISESS